MAKIRQNYLAEDKNLPAETKTQLVSATGHMDELKSLFRSAGQNYQRLFSATQSAAAEQ